MLIDQPSYTVLIVEDSPDTMRILSIQLGHSNIKPVPKTNGQNALEWLETNQPDLIILDLMLPDMNGLDVCRQIRKQYSPVEVPIIILSAIGYDADVRAEGLEAGANEIIGKPYHFFELLTCVRTQLKIIDSSR